MGQGNTQTNRTMSGVVPDQSTARLPRTCTTTKQEQPSYPKLRGLDLIKSCAKFYENGVGVGTATGRLSYHLAATLNQPAITQVPSSRHSKLSIGTVAVSLFLSLLPILGVATIMWGRFVSELAKELALTVGSASATAAQLPAPAIRASLNLKSVAAAQTTSNESSDIIVHKVKTELITGEALRPDPNIR